MWHIQQICEEFDAGLVGPTIERRRAQGQFQCVADGASNGIPFGAGHLTFTAKIAPADESRIGIIDSISPQGYRHRASIIGPYLQCESRRCFCVFNPRFVSVAIYLRDLSPKIAVPTRTQFDPSSMATSKSCDIPIESMPTSTPDNLRAAI
jgi:hypothetical protein